LRRQRDSFLQDKITGFCDLDVINNFIQVIFRLCL